MLTICNWDNVACIVEHFPQSLDPVYLPGIVILGAIAFAYIVASYFYN
jgi:hypothetical protein